MRMVRRLDLELGYVRQRDLRHDADRRLEPGGPSTLQLEDFDVGVVDRIDRLVIESLAHDLGHHRLDDFFAQDGGTDSRLDEGARGPAGPEAFDLGPRGEAVQHPVVGGVDHLGGDLDGHADLALRQALGHD